MKNLVIEQIENKIKDAKAASYAVIADMELEAKKIFEAQMSFKQDELKKLSIALDNSRDLTEIEHDEFVHRFIRVDFSKLIDTNSELEKELLSEYLSEHYSMYVDYKYDTISQCEGPCILVDDDGTAYDQDAGKTIVKRGDYESKEQFFELIEAYMDKSGYYPSIVRYGRYGVIGYVDTQRKAG